MPDCWKCGGLGAHFPAFDDDGPFYIVHRTTERECALPEAQVIANIREAA